MSGQALRTQTMKDDSLKPGALGGGIGVAATGSTGKGVFAA